MAKFKPHGLIWTPLQEVLYHEAHWANIKHGISNPKEHKTVALVQAISSQNIFTAPTYATASQWPPQPNSTNKADQAILYLDAGTNGVLCLDFDECKRASTRQPFSLRALETQALDYCYEYLQYYKSVPFVYATTSAGAHMRVWRILQGSRELLPFWGVADLGVWDEYKDLGDEIQGNIVHDAYKTMMAYPPTAVSGQTTGYGTSTYAGTSSLTYAGPSSPTYATYSYTIPPLKSSSTLDAATCTEVRISDTNNDTYTCQLYDGTTKNLAKDGWEAATIMVEGNTYSCHAYTGKKSGVTYYTYYWVEQEKGKDVVMS